MNFAPPDTAFTVLLDRERGGNDTKYDMNYVCNTNQSAGQAVGLQGQTGSKANR